MPNKNYIAGYVREQNIRKYLEQKGYICFASRGSHSKIDIIAIDFKKNKIHLIQSKKQKLSENAHDTILMELNMMFPLGFYYLYNEVLDGDWKDIKKEISKW